MKGVPPPLSGNYIPLTSPTDLDEPILEYGKRTVSSADSMSSTTDSVSCVHSDQSSELTRKSLPQENQVLNPQGLLNLTLMEILMHQHQKHPIEKDQPKETSTSDSSFKRHFDMCNRSSCDNSGSLFSNSVCDNGICL